MQKNKWIIAISLCALFLSATSLFAADKTRAKTADELRKEYIGFLSTQGYQGKVDRDGDVGFMCDGQYYFIQVEPDTPQFFRIVLASDWKIDNDADRLRIIRAAEFATGNTKGAKVFLVKNRVWVSVELFLSEPNGYHKVFFLSMQALQNGMLSFLEKMKELKNQ